MAEDRQPPSVKEGAASAAAADIDLEDDAASKAKSAEDRKAAVALASLDAAGPSSGSKHVDHEAMSKAMKDLRLGASGTAAKKVKVDAADVALLVGFPSPPSPVHVFLLLCLANLQVDQLDMTKTKATDLLKQHEGDAVKALRAYVTVA